MKSWMKLSNLLLNYIFNSFCKRTYINCIWLTCTFVNKFRLSEYHSRPGRIKVCCIDPIIIGPIPNRFSSI